MIGQLKSFLSDFCTAFVNSSKRANSLMIAFSTFENGRLLGVLWAWYHSRILCLCFSCVIPSSIPISAIICSRETGSGSDVLVGSAALAGELLSTDRLIG